MRELLLVRHGLAGKPDARAWPDDDRRPLTEKGIKAFKAAAKGLRALECAPALVLSSPTLRTRQTAVLLAKVLKLGPGAISDFPAAHHARDPRAALKLLAARRLPKSAALVGHEPWLGECLALLIGARRGAALPFAKGGAALVRFPSGKAGPGAGELAWFLTRDQLAGLA